MKNFIIKNNSAKLIIAFCILILVALVFSIAFLDAGTMAKAESIKVQEFSLVEEFVGNEHIIIGRNLDKFELSNSECIATDVNEELSGISERELALLKKIGFDDVEIGEMTQETRNLYTTTDYFESRTAEYFVKENGGLDIMPLASDSEKYNKLIVTNTLASNGIVNGNNRYVASIKVQWTSKPLNQLTDFLYIACGNGNTVHTSQYRECYLSYTNKIIVPQIGTMINDFKYTNGDGSGKIVTHDNNTNGEGWKINVPFMPSYNQYHYNIVFFMRAEVTIPKNTTGGVYYAYLHQKLAGSAGFSISASGPSVSFSPKYTMDLFTGPHFTIESNGAIV